MLPLLSEGFIQFCLPYLLLSEVSDDEWRVPLYVCQDVFFNLSMVLLSLAMISAGIVPAYIQVSVDILLLFL